uniref:Homoserine kinase n=1 Tax=Fibrocapsa japonica TaxID=94617 RepID=A0A7S2UU71_9STRA|mmetsp:Transcript_13620/g.20021  ORF Transcript_13620/g.20021 Transcript_13620/m.20021 type:complete len:428 (+) Transcript_13620:128-1411(+)|eukprot:CAMPEP_0113937904 /NCGR_PEP_ID=MMETSP1339-20121228/4393_1 /TAXON_ID=94617 /ORGANISM="Fibrocapsa japonica" /LENGTH=427 /DNA_ID=CAMNT_0000940813 /DNA_START=128 /DNA_END=1411 /DNA_ORIENTATION=- /assembly_acc=CAM_ASM_000762
MDAKIRNQFIGLATVSAALVAIAYIRSKSQNDQKVKKQEEEGNEREDLGRNSSWANNDLTDNSAPVPLMPHEHEKRMSQRMQKFQSEVIDEVSQERNKVTVRVPATSANLGPGYDCLGMAVDMWSEVTVERADKFSMEFEGDGAADLPINEENLLCVGVKAAFQAAGKQVPPLKYTCKSRIPYARGLGSSSAAIVGGLIAGLVLAGHQLPCWGKEALLNMASEIEGHPDNVAPALYGGIQIGIHSGERWTSERVPCPPGLQAVLFIPNTVGITKEVRGVLKDEVPRKDATFNIGRVAWLINALATGNIDNIKFGVQDALHQPQRGKHCFPHMQPLIEAAVNAGANGAYLSGAGPTIMAITSGVSGDMFTQRFNERVDSEVGDAMLAAAKKCGVQGQVYITRIIENGAQVTYAEPNFSRDVLRYHGDV